MIQICSFPHGLIRLIRFKFSGLYMRIYTGKGDFGKTRNFNGQSIDKNSSVIQLLGALDEINSYLGLIKAMLSNCSFIEAIQKNIMKLMSHVSGMSGDDCLISENDVKTIEKEIDKLSDNIPQRHELIVPGKNVTEAQIQIARTIARRAEILFFAANTKNDLSSQAGVYLNRLSDYLFILSQQDL